MVLVLEPGIDQVQEASLVPWEGLSGEVREFGWYLMVSCELGENGNSGALRNFEAILQ